MAIVRSVNSTLDLVLACPGIHNFCGMFPGHILHGLLNKACIGAFLVHSLTGGAMMRKVEQQDDNDSEAEVCHYAS